MLSASIHGASPHPNPGLEATHAAERLDPARDEPDRDDRVQGRGKGHRAKERSAEQGATKVSLSDEAKEAQRLDELSPEDKRVVEELKARDAEVRAHEQAHLAAAGGYARGGVQYETQRGPDNKLYAVGGHVQIDTAPIEGDPARSIQKAQTVRRAALAPRDPSGQDRQVAAKATQSEKSARDELAAQKREAAADLEVSREAPQTLAQAGELEPSSSSAPRSYAMSAYARFAG